MLPALFVDQFFWPILCLSPFLDAASIQLSQVDLKLSVPLLAQALNIRAGMWGFSLAPCGTKIMSMIVGLDEESLAKTLKILIAKLKDFSRMLPTTIREGVLLRNLKTQQ
jgi:hypothetical protein